MPRSAWRRCSTSDSRRDSLRAPTRWSPTSPAERPPGAAMRVTIFTQYYPPEVGGPATRLHAFAAGLAGRGHHVTVLCEVPNYPQGVIHREFRGRPVIRRTLDGCHILYVWVQTSPKRTALRRLSWYGSYALLATAVGMPLPRPDVIFASSPPLTVGIPAAVLSRMRNTPLVLDVRDLWTEAAMALGELTQPQLISGLEMLEKYLYDSAAHITTVTKPFCEAIASAIGDKTKVSLIPNGTTRLWVDAADLEPSRAELGLRDDRFIWTFAGNVGLAQGLESVVDAAELLDERFQLLILGNGTARAALEMRATSVRPGKIVFRDQLPPEQAALYLRASDALVVPLKAAPVLASFVPSKLFDCCAVGKPVIVAAAGEPSRLVREAGAGLPIAPGDPTALAGAVRRLEADSGLGRQLAQAGRAFGAEHLRERQVERLAAILTVAAARSNR